MESHGPPFRQVVAVFVLLAAFLSIDVSAASAQAASYPIDTWGAPVNVRSGPGTEFPIVGSLAEGTMVTISCTEDDGANVEGPSGTTRVWDMIGNNRWVADAFVYTGTFAPVAGKCLDQNRYPWPNLGATEWVDDGAGYYAGECVSFAAWAVREDDIANQVSPNWRGNGNMWDWYPSPVTAVSSPRVGDVAQWDEWRNGAGELGHVAYVSTVHGDGTITIMEYNWGAAHRFGTRRIGVGVPSRYLRF